MVKLCGIILDIISILSAILGLLTPLKEKFKDSKISKAKFSTFCAIVFVIGILLVFGSYIEPKVKDGSEDTNMQGASTNIGTINIDTINGNVSIGTNNTDDPIHQDKNNPPTQYDKVENDTSTVNHSTGSLESILDSLEDHLGVVAQSSNYLVDMLYAENLINEGMKYCSGPNPDYKLAGQLFESAIEYGDNESHTAKNNLAYLIRKGFYESDIDPEELLSDGISLRKDMSLVNKALICAERGEWEEADKYFLLMYSSGDYDSVVTWWTKLSESNDPEGDLVLGWIKRYNSNLLTSKTQEQYLKNASKTYDIPDWLYDPYEY